MIDRKVKEEALKALIRNQSKATGRDEVDSTEMNELFKRMISPIANPVGYSNIRSAFKVNPMCSECYMEFESDEIRSLHTPNECAVYKVHSS